MTVTVSGSLVQVLDAVAFLEGVAPHQLLNDVVRSWLAEAAQDPGVRSAQAAAPPTSSPPLAVPRRGPARRRGEQRAGAGAHRGATVTTRDRGRGRLVREGDL